MGASCSGMVTDRIESLHGRLTGFGFGVDVDVDVGVGVVLVVWLFSEWSNQTVEKSLAAGGF